MKVNILMSTYNGEKFVAEQIQSIQQQTFTDWQLLVRDDGSQDSTRQIVERFVKSDSRIQLIAAENVGVIQSFFHLVKFDRTADYYFFADQDDFWLPEKLQLMLDEAAQHDNRQPILYYSDLKVVDQKLKVLSPSMIRSQSGHANTTLVQELTENTVTGCTSMINAALAAKWQSCEHIIMHDWYLALLAAAYGELVYLNQATILYRQHGDNVLGSRTLSKRMKNWFSHWFRRYWQLIIASQRQAQKILDEAENGALSNLTETQAQKNPLSNLTEAKRELISAYVTILEQPRSQRRAILNKYKLRKNKNYHTLIFRTLIKTKFAYKSYIRSITQQ